MQHAFLIAGTLALAIDSAQAQMPCGPAAMIYGSITGTQYGEVPIARGLTGNKDNPNFMLFFANPKTGTWTLTVRNAAGLACLVASGTDFAPADPKSKTGGGL